jgi:hypothetical protein
MSENPTSTGIAASSGLTDMESNLGQALALIHRVLPRLDEASRASDVQAALQKAAGCVELARQAHQRTFAFGKSAVAGAVQTGLESEIVAVISAAVAAVLDRPYRLVSVQPVVAPVPHLNVWALEGRTQIFQSHKIR